MDVKINKGVAKGQIDMPSSKSFIHRYLIGAMLANGESTISNAYINNDIKATLDCLSSFGTNYVILDNKIIVTSDNHIINDKPIFTCYESGSTLRFMIPVALTKYNNCTFTCTERLLKRGIGLYEDIFKNQEIHISTDSLENKIEIEGSLKSGYYKVNGNISSQYITGLLFALPLLEGDSVIEVIPPIESKNYIDITIYVLEKYGIKIIIKDNIYYIQGNQKYIPCDTVCEGDYSNAAFLDAYNYLDGNVVLNNLSDNSLQGDKVYKEYFKRLNAGFDVIDIGDAIDLGPVLFAFSSLKNGGRFINTRRLAIKESDRASAMADELRKMNVDITVLENEVIIKKSVINKPNTIFDSHNDHRIVMSLCLFSYLFDVEIANVEAVNKSFPTFFECLKKIGLEIKYVN